MDHIWDIFAGILFLNTLAALSISGVLVARGLRKPGSFTVAWMFIALAVWAFAYAMITISASLEAKHFWLKIENIGIVSTPVFWFLFTSRYTRQDKWITRPVQFLLFIIPLITLIFLFSGHWFELHYASTRPYSASGGPLIIERGPWYWAQLSQSYLMLAAGMILMLWHLFIYRSIYRKRILTVLAGLAVPVALNLFYQVGANLMPSVYIPVDLTPISFTVTAGLISFAIFGQHLFDMTPIARHVVLENIVEMVLVVDGTDRILDVNNAALTWIDKTADQMIGQDIFDVFDAWPEVADHYRTGDATSQSFNLSGEAQHIVEVTISPIYDRFGHLDGRVIVAHDVTKNRAMEQSLQKANEDLKTKLEQIEELQTQLREQAIRDPLTGLYNRRYLTEALDAEIARVVRDGQSLSAILMDIDHFKEFNDRYGHKCGDQVLQYLSVLLLEQTRRGDTVCRYGGEEFVILMPKVSIDVAISRAEAWREAFSNAVINYEGQELRAQLSAGVAPYSEDMENGEDLLKAADQAMYQSKANGRNLVTAYPFDVVEKEIHE